MSPLLALLFGVPLVVSPLYVLVRVAKGPTQKPQRGVRLYSVTTNRYFEEERRDH